MLHPNLHQIQSGALAACLLLAAGACGDDYHRVPDAGNVRSTALEILTPPGDSIGLNFSGSATLRVRFVDDEGKPIAGGQTQFKLVSSASESTGGASLSSAMAVTDELGIARVDLLSGAERVNFRVEVSAAQAPPVLFFIQVSEQGFADLQLRSAHEGPRDPELFDRVQLRIYSQPTVSCQTMNFDEQPVSFFPSRTQSSIGELSEFANLAADESYTVIAWGERQGSRPLATGCLDLSADKLRSGSTFEASILVVDRSFELNSPLLLETNIDLLSLRDSLPSEEHWRALACPLGRAQLLLDCLADAQVNDGAMDCDGESASPLSAAMVARRGVLDAEGCRTAMDSGGANSLDNLLAQSLGGWPSPTELLALSDGRSTVLDLLRVRSRLTPQSSAIASHRILRAELGSFALDLVTSDRPVVEASGLPLAIGAAPLLSLGNHGFTLRYGELAALAYEELALTPAEVSTLGGVLGTELMAGVTIGAQTGCTALESFVCSSLSLAAGCANGCASIATPLNTLLSEWLPAISTLGLDYSLTLKAITMDSDDDLLIESISSPADFNVELRTASETLSVPATFSGLLE